LWNAQPSFKVRRENDTERPNTKRDSPQRPTDRPKGKTNQKEVSCVGAGDLKIYIH